MDNSIIFLSDQDFIDNDKQTRPFWPYTRGIL